jgi:uncharacterized protein
LEAPITHQVAALPFRFDDEGHLEVMLITSRGGQRWIPPKGHLIAGLLPHEAAAQEAYEEAGVIGHVSPRPLGQYQALKRHGDGTADRLDILLFPMRVDERADDWPERGQRMILWFEPEGAANVVEEPELARLIEALARRSSDFATSA